MACQTSASKICNQARKHSLIKVNTPIVATNEYYDAIVIVVRDTDVNFINCAQQDKRK
jgi:hypothetical protein